MDSPPITPPSNKNVNRISIDATKSRSVLYQGMLNSSSSSLGASESSTASAGSFCPAIDNQEERYALSQCARRLRRVKRRLLLLSVAGAAPAPPPAMIAEGGEGDEGDMSPPSSPPLSPRMTDQDNFREILLNAALHGTMPSAPKNPSNTINN